LDKKFKSIVDELCDYIPNRDREHFIESRAIQVIASFANLRKLISESYDEETADDLFKRLVNAARTGDEKKVTRKLKEIKKEKANGTRREP
jgi:uncharacterized protein (UPF0305 family)